MGYKASDVVKIVIGEVGYIEKASNAQLDDKTANAGNKNYTKYARDLYKAGYYNGNKQGFAYCDVGHDWVHWKAAGENKELAEYVTCQTGDLGAGCTYSMRYYKAAGRFYEKDPKPGDQIFFGSGNSSTHTGIVIKVDGARVYTVEFNTSGESGEVANGGGVFEKSYPLGYSRIVGYGRPRYDKEETSSGKTVTESTYSLKSFIEDVQKACAAKVDGIAGGETISKTVTVSAKINSTHAVVKPLQKRLYALGYTEVGKADGIAGPKFTKAVKRLQNNICGIVDGEVTAGCKTWRYLLGMK